MKKTLGGDRVGSGAGIQVELDSYPRSTHNKRYIVRTTQSPGTLVPICYEVILPGDHWKVKLSALAKTKPTTGPLWGSFKLQLDVATAAYRLYQGRLHQNEVDLGLDMANVKLPIFQLNAPVLDSNTFKGDLNSAQINPSSIFAHLGLMGIGQANPNAPDNKRSFNGTWWLMYWDFYKNYVANKQEKIGKVVHTDMVDLVQNVGQIDADQGVVQQQPLTSTVPIYYGQGIVITLAGPIQQPLNQIIFQVSNLPVGGNIQNVSAEAIGNVIQVEPTQITLEYRYTNIGATRYLQSWRYANTTDIPTKSIGLATFQLSQLDQMRGKILAYPYSTSLTTPFNINDADLFPFKLAFAEENTGRSIMCSQEGLGIVTYQSDLFNNWLNAESISTANARSNVSTTGGSFSMDAIIMSQKIFNLYNNIIAGGSTVDDWEEAVWGMQKNNRPEIPQYEGGLSQEIVFEEVVSTANVSAAGQPLATLAGKGRLDNQRNGGEVNFRASEMGMLMIFASIKPRVDYTQGNDWSYKLESIDDLHKPEFDQIGFQNLDAEQMHWLNAAQRNDGSWLTQTVGKQPAWMNYRTNVNRARGNFAIGYEGADSEQFMILARNYGWLPAPDGWFEMADPTTYIDPVKFNQAFAQTDLNAQNFWMQYGIDLEVTRIMNPRLMPNM